VGYLKTEYISKSASETESIAKDLSTALGRGCTIALYGELGAGKTVFARGILRGLGYTGVVSSPTFTIVNEYELDDHRVAHFDMYRVDNEDTLEAAGFFEHITTGSTIIIEWSERIEHLLKTYRSIDLTRVYIYGSGEDKRRIVVE